MEAAPKSPRNNVSHPKIDGCGVFYDETAELQSGPRDQQG